MNIAHTDTAMMIYLQHIVQEDQGICILLKDAVFVVILKLNMCMHPHFC